MCITNYQPISQGEAERLHKHTAYVITHTQPRPHSAIPRIDTSSLARYRFTRDSFNSSGKVERYCHHVHESLSLNRR
jgi:hypothetical protein